MGLNIILYKKIIARRLPCSSFNFIFCHHLLHSYEWFLVILIDLFDLHMYNVSECSHFFLSIPM